MEITSAEITRLADTLETLPSGLNARERLVLREVFRLAVAVTGEAAAETAEGRSPGLIALRSEPLPEAEGSLPPITDGFERALQPGAAASFDLSKSAAGEAGPESLRITARLV